MTLTQQKVTHMGASASSALSVDEALLRTDAYAGTESPYLIFGFG